MKTQNVFLDTTEFISNAFNFEGSRLSILAEKASHGSIQIFTTDVVYRECVNRIGIFAEEAHNAYKRFLDTKGSPRARAI